MSKVPFRVSARTAKLIGRENVANANGAIVELVKNTYDADAKNCIVFVENKYHSIPTCLSKMEYNKFSSESQLISECYKINLEGNYDLFPRSEDILAELQSFFLSHCYILIIDNGSGMNNEIIKNNWMTIGTDAKDKDYISLGGRVKTGAKGIGRFALDRLGKYCEMYTLPENQNDGYVWKVDWSDFEKPSLSIDQISAELNDVPDMNLKEIIKSITNNYGPICRLINENDINFDGGTILKISSLNDDWDEYQVTQIFENLEILLPPKELLFDFKIYLLSTLEKHNYGQISPDFCDDFDYKVSGKYLDDENKTVIISIERNELDMEIVKKDFMKVFEYEKMKQYPYDFESLKKDKLIIEKTLPKLIPGFKNVDDKKVLDEIGKFTFTFYFLKNQVSSNEKVYPYRTFTSAFRKEWLRKFSGIKIFRDDFRIRPYGESGNDWLGLGNRSAQSPSSAGQSLGGYRVRPHQISGSLHISRITNVKFQDKSGREGIQENDEFSVLKEILIGIISIFENDRNHIMYHFKKYNDDVKKAEKIKAEKLAQKLAEEAARKKIEEEERNKGKEVEESTNNLKNEEREIEENDSSENDNTDNLNILATGLKAQEIELNQKDEELRISRSLSSSGLLIASFAHEFKNLQRKLGYRTQQLKEQLMPLLPPTKINNLKDFENPYVLIDEIEAQDARLAQWLKLSILALKKDKRRRQHVDISQYLDELHDTWVDLLLERSIKLSITSENKVCKIRAFPIDLDSIFSNLIANSIDAFKDKRASKERSINISWKMSNNGLIIIYSDTGGGLSSDYDDPDVIFNAFETTKRDRHGNIIGTGLGMWIVKSIIDDYKGKIRILKPEIGFSVEIILPLIK